ncbi:hypothetical protein C7820_4174 [Paenibacillus sp. VMFN-D1]|nr:hypothetical protein C7820_4174 [Paenibacillus sp. VMFN-D1]
MLSSRFYLYLFFISSMMGGSVVVSKVLLQYRYRGSMASLITAIILVICLMLMFYRVQKKFPGQNLAEIMGRTYPGWFKNLFLLYQQLLLYATGSLVLVGTTKVAITFIAPEMHTFHFLFLVSLLIVGTAMLESVPLLKMMEIAAVITIPIYILFTARVLTDETMLSDSIIEATTYITVFPNFNAVTAATFVFMSCTNMLVFFRHIEFIPIKHISVAALIGVANLLACYFVPIGYLGLNGAAEEVFVWQGVLDSMRFNYLPVERMTSVFLLVQLGMSLLFVILCWHSSLQYHDMTKGGGKVKWLFVSFFVASTFIIEYYTDETGLVNWFVGLFSIRLFSELFLLLVLMQAAAIQKRRS